MSAEDLLSHPEFGHYADKRVQNAIAAETSGARRQVSGPTHNRERLAGLKQLRKNRQDAGNWDETSGTNNWAPTPKRG